MPNDCIIDASEKCVAHSDNLPLRCHDNLDDDMLQACGFPMSVHSCWEIILVVLTAEIPCSYLWDNGKPFPIGEAQNPGPDAAKEIHFTVVN